MKSIMLNRITRALAPRARIGPVIIAVALGGLFAEACDVHHLSDPGTASALVVSPNPKTLAITGTQQFTAVATDFSGAAVTVTPTWSIVAGGGTISASGLFTAGTVPGTFVTVKATSGSLSNTATIIVIAGPLTTITVTPSPMSIGIGTTQQYVAVGKDASGNVVQFTPTWSVINGGGAVNGTGMFTAGNTAGTYTNTVQASNGAITGTATVTETSGGLTTIVVTPNPVSLNTGVRPAVHGGRQGCERQYRRDHAGLVGRGRRRHDCEHGRVHGRRNAGQLPEHRQGNERRDLGHGDGERHLAGPRLDQRHAEPGVRRRQRNAAVRRRPVETPTATSFRSSPSWTVVNGGGSINVNGLFTAGAVTGTFNNTVQAASGAISGTATVIVTATPPSQLVNLGAAAPNGIMAGTAFTCVNLGTINADIAISPGNTVTGFPPCTITGTQHLNDATAVQGQIDLTNAYNTLAGLPCPPANAIVANLGGTTKAAGVYCTASGIGVTGTLTLDGGGDPNATFVFQAGTSLTTAGNIVLINGAQAKNVYWQVGSSATLGTASQWQGNILTLTSITLVDNATLVGRALARNGAVSLGTGNVITLP